MDQTRSEPTHPWQTRELQQVGSGLQNPETDSGESVGGFSALKPASTDPTRALLKSGDTKIFRRVFGQNTLDFYEICVKFREISPNLVISQLDLVEISSYLARSHQIRWDLHWIWRIFTWNQLFWPDFLP